MAGTQHHWQLMFPWKISDQLLCLKMGWEVGRPSRVGSGRSRVRFAGTLGFGCVESGWREAQGASVDEPQVGAELPTGRGPGFG